MAGKESGNAAAPTQAAAAAADAPAAAGPGKDARERERDAAGLSIDDDYSKPLPRHDDDDDDHNPYKDEWNDGVDFFNELRRHLAAEQAVLRAEYIIKGCIHLGHNQVARRSQLSHQVFLETKPAGADDGHADFFEKLYRGQEDDDESESARG